MIVARLHERMAAAVGFSNLYQRDLVLQKIRQGESAGLISGVGHLDSKAYAKVVALRSIERQLEYGMKIQFSRTCLHVSLVAPDVKHINEG